MTMSTQDQHMGWPVVPYPKQYHQLLCYALFHDNTLITLPGVSSFAGG